MADRRRHRFVLWFAGSALVCAVLWLCLSQYLLSGSANLRAPLPYETTDAGVRNLRSWLEVAEFEGRIDWKHETIDDVLKKYTRETGFDANKFLLTSNIDRSKMIQFNPSSEKWRNREQHLEKIAFYMPVVVVVPKTHQKVYLACDFAYHIITIEPHSPWDVVTQEVPASRD